MSMGNDDVVLSGDVEIDGCHIGGHVRPENRKVDRKDRRLAENKDADRRVVIALCERQAPHSAILRPACEGPLGYLNFR